MRYVAFLCLLAAQGELPVPVGERSANVPSAQAPYEMLRQDAGWCGPRILYFFACYLGKECTLKQVVDLCGTDDEGRTSLLQLSEAARSLGLEPIPIACGAEELPRIGGPFIMCVRRPRRLPDGRWVRGGDIDGPVHFVGVVRCEAGGNFLAVDPSSSTQAIVLAPEDVARAYTGHAVLLRKNATAPLLWRLLTFPWIMLPSALTAAFAVWLVRTGTRRASVAERAGLPWHGSTPNMP